MAVSAALRRLVRDRAALRCEYCLLAEEDAFLPHEPDHILALKHGGSTDESNLSLACFQCNRHKGSDIASVDPATGEVIRLFDPRRDAWTEHYSTSHGTVVALTPVARATVTLLRINHAARVEARNELARIGRWPRLPDRL